MPELGDQVVLGLVDHTRTDVTEFVELRQHGDELFVLVTKHIDGRTGGIDGIPDGVLLGDECSTQAVDRVQGVDDVALLGVERADQRVDLGEHVPDLAGAAVHHCVELLCDGLQLAEASASEHERQGAEDFFDLGVAAGAIHRDHVVGTEPTDAGGLAVSPRRSGQIDELLTQEACLANFSHRVVGQYDVLADQHLDPGVPADPDDFFDLPDRNISDHDRRARHQVEGVSKVGADLKTVALADLVPGERQVVDAVELTPTKGECQERGHDHAHA